VVKSGGKVVFLGVTEAGDGGFLPKKKKSKNRNLKK